MSLSALLFQAIKFGATVHFYVTFVGLKRVLSYLDRFSYSICHRLPDMMKMLLGTVSNRRQILSLCSWSSRLTWSRPGVLCVDLIILKEVPGELQGIPDPSRYVGSPGDAQTHSTDEHSSEKSRLSTRHPSLSPAWSTVVWTHILTVGRCHSSCLHSRCLYLYCPNIQVSTKHEWPNN